MNRCFALLTAVALLSGCVAAAERDVVAVYRTPTCNCCSKWLTHLEEDGFTVEDHVVSDLAAIKSENRIPGELASCHTAFVGGYVIEGHVPAEDIARLLETKPEIAGLAVPGMPIGSPGMEGPNPETYRILAFDRTGKVTTFRTQVP